MNVTTIKRRTKNRGGVTGNRCDILEGLNDKLKEEREQIGMRREGKAGVQEAPWTEHGKPGEQQAGRVQRKEGWRVRKTKDLLQTEWNQRRRKWKLQLYLTTSASSCSPVLMSRQPFIPV